MDDREVRLKALELAGNNVEKAREYADYITGKSDAAIIAKYYELLGALSNVPGFSIFNLSLSSSAVANFLNPPKATALSQSCRKSRSGKRQ